MVPDALAAPEGRRGARIPPHSRYATRRTPGLEAAVVDHGPMTITSLDDGDDREATVNVAGPAALLVAKLHKLGERQDDPGRLVDKDAHDSYRLLVAADTPSVAERLSTLRADDLAGRATGEAFDYLSELFASPDAIGSVMAGRAEQLVGDPAVVSAAAAALANDLLVALHV